MWTGLWVLLSGLAVALVAPMIGHAVKLAEFRQTWINELRKDVADYLGLARRWARGYEAYVILDAQHASETVLDAKRDEVASILNDARVIMWRIQMRINPRENEAKRQDDLFLKSLADVTNPDVVLPYEPDFNIRWNTFANTVVSESRELLKREWNVTKQFLPQWMVKTYCAITAFAVSAYRKCAGKP